MKKEKSKETTILVDLTKKQLEKLQLIINIGMYPNKSTFIKEAIKEKLKKLESYSKTKN